MKYGGIIIKGSRDVVDIPELGYTVKYTVSGRVKSLSGFSRLNSTQINILIMSLSGKKYP